MAESSTPRGAEMVGGYREVMGARPKGSRKDKIRKVGGVGVKE